MDADPHVSKHLYFERHFGCMAARVLPGEYYVAHNDMVILTVLGSCVSACLRDRDSGVGGINHFMLPGGSDEGPVSLSMRYGAMAMEILINQLLKAGAQRSRLEAKVFGGGRVLSGLDTLNVGERNAQFVQAYLRAEGIPLLAADLNDIHPRKLAYFPATGRALVRKLTTASRRVVQSERQYSVALSTKPLPGDIALF